MQGYLPPLQQFPTEVYRQLVYQEEEKLRGKSDLRHLGRGGISSNQQPPDSNHIENILMFDDSDSRNEFERQDWQHCHHLCKYKYHNR